MAINLLAEDRQSPINLLQEEQAPLSFENLSPEQQELILNQSREQISQKHPQMPHWLQEAILHLSPKNDSPLLASAARGVTDVTNLIPAAAGGALQGASIPIRGALDVASPVLDPLINRGINALSQSKEQRPEQNILKSISQSPDLRGLFPKAEGTLQKTAQLASELGAGGGAFGKLLQGVKNVNKLAHIPKALQSPLALLAETGFIATPGDLSQKELGAAGALALGGAGKVAKKTIETLPPFLRGLSSDLTPEVLVEAIQKPHDMLKRTEDALYNEVRSSIKKRNIKIPIKEQYLNEAAEILPKTRATRQLIDKARNGDYDAVHDVQSHLYKKGSKGLSSNDIALENQGEEIMELRNKMNEDLESHLLNDGHLDIAHILRQGKKTHATLMNNFYAKNLNKKIGKLVHPELRQVPKSLENVFMEDSIPMKEFLDKYPEIGKVAKDLSHSIKVKEGLRKALLTSGFASSTLGGGKAFYDLFL